MPRFRRQILTLAMLALYGTVSLSGYGLHELMESESTHASSEGGGATVKALANHCPICEFQAQGQLPVEPVVVVSQPYTSPHVAITLALVASRGRHLISCPRAPPASSLPVA